MRPKITANALSAAAKLIAIYFGSDGYDRIWAPLSRFSWSCRHIKFLGKVFIVSQFSVLSVRAAMRSFSSAVNGTSTSDCGSIVQVPNTNGAATAPTIARNIAIFHCLTERSPSHYVRRRCRTCRTLIRGAIDFRPWNRADSRRLAHHSAALDTAHETVPVLNFSHTILRRADIA